MDRISRNITPVAPFDFELTAGYLTYFQGRYAADSLVDRVYRRLLDLDGQLVLASVSSLGSLEKPELSVELQGEGLTSDNVEVATDKVAWILGVGQKLGPFYASAQGDPAMAAITQRFYGLHMPHTASVFEALVLAVLGQQIATNVARIIRTLLIETYGPRQTIDGETHYAFPRPETLAALRMEDLRGMKLSQRKAEYVHGIACTALDDPEFIEGLYHLDDEAVVRQITSLRGVGNWTAQWLLIRALGRPDALPLGDLALRRVVSRLYFQDEPLNDTEVEEFCRRWSPYRTYATTYMFTAMRTGMA
jgi:DNA-3-methyladenine glycosylase II